MDQRHPLPAAEPQPDVMQSAPVTAESPTSRAVLASTVIILVTTFIAAYLLDGGAPITMTAFRLRAGIALMLWLVSRRIQYSDHGQYRGGRWTLVARVVVDLGGIIVLWAILQEIESRRSAYLAQAEAGNRWEGRQ